MQEITPAINLKCIVFTVVLASGYWFLPCRNKFVLIALLYFPYVVLAWYDYWYDCRRNMGPTYLANFYDFLKPPESDQIQQYKQMSPKWKKRILIVDLVIAVILFILCALAIKTNNC